MKKKNKLEITAGHLYALNILYRAKKVNYQRFVPDMNPILDLTEWGLSSKQQDNYQLTEFGREYFEGVIKFASRRLNSHLKPF